jgi:hypothetical protein
MVKLGGIRLTARRGVAKVAYIFAGSSHLLLLVCARSKLLSDFQEFSNFPVCFSTAEANMIATGDAE